MRSSSLYSISLLNVFKVKELGRDTHQGGKKDK